MSNMIEAFDCDYREVIMTVTLTGNGKEVTVDRDGIISVTTLEEVMSETDTPIGIISSNEIYIELDNKNNLFTLDEFYNKSDDVLKIERSTPMTLNIEVDGYDGVINMGQFYVSDAILDYDNMMLKITANDILHLVLNNDVTSFPVLKDCSVRDIITKLFDFCGISSDNININTFPSISLKYYKNTDETLGNALQRICESFGIFIYVARDNKITCANMFDEKDVLGSITSDSQIFKCDSIVSLSNKFKEVNIQYQNLQVQNSKELASIQDVEVKKQSTYIIQGVNLEHSPILNIDNIVITSSMDVRCTRIVSNGNMCDIYLQNTGDLDRVVNVSIYGSYLDETTFNTTTTSNTNDIFELKNTIIPDLDIALSYKSQLDNFFSKKQPTLSLDVRGNPAYQLCDCVAIDIPERNLRIKSKIVSQCLNYDGSLEGTIRVLNLGVLQ